MDQIYGEFTKEELDYVMEVIVQITKERAGDKNFKKIQLAAAWEERLPNMLASFGMTEQEALDYKGNPITSKLILRFVFLLLSMFAPLLIMLILPEYFLNDHRSKIELVQSILIGLSAVSLSESLISFIRFHRMKKGIRLIQEVNDMADRIAAERIANDGKNEDRPYAVSFCCAK